MLLVVSGTPRTPFSTGHTRAINERQEKSSKNWIGLSSGGKLSGMQTSDGSWGEMVTGGGIRCRIPANRESLS